MDSWRSLMGMVEVELTSADVSSALSAIYEQNIALYEIRQMDELTAYFLVMRKDMITLNKLTEKRGDQLRVNGRKGAYWTLKKLPDRPIFFWGVALLLLLALYLPTRVFFVQVEGNTSVPTRYILEMAWDSGIRFGASRREVRSEKMKNTLLEAIPQLQWAGINTSGCVAMISVKERAPEETKKDTADVSSIVAVRDGYIISATATSGNLVCHSGQAVKEGQLLISGYTDCGFCIQATAAEGEVFAQTNRDLTVCSPKICLKKGVQKTSGTKGSLIIGKKRINLWKDSGIWDATCDRIYKEYYITLPGGFAIPVALCVEHYIQRETECVERDRKNTEFVLNEYAKSYLRQQMVAGSILSNAGVFTVEKDMYQLNSSYVCVEMIGRVQREQIGESNGKSG